MKTTHNYVVWQKRRANYSFFIYKAYRATPFKTLKTNILPPYNDKYYRLVLLELLVLLVLLKNKSIKCSTVEK